MSKKILSSENRFYWIYLVGFFLILTLPLLNSPPWFSPPDWGKTIVFRTVLSLIIIALIWQIISNPIIYRNKWKILSASRAFWLLIVFWGIFLLATIFSLDRHFSFWGSPHRADGFVNFTFYVFFVILTFLIIKRRHWQKAWDFSLLIAILVSAIAIFQRLPASYGTIFVFEYERSGSTIGGPTFLAAYLLLLSFLALSFGIKERSLIKKIFYFFSLFVFIFTIASVTQTRAAIIGLITGFFFFLALYPVKKRWLSLTLKAASVAVMLVITWGIYYINTLPELPEFIQENRFFKETSQQRFSIESLIQNSRISSWIISWEALRARPFLGYGPGNFSIGFDRFYDPTLPNIISESSTTNWWDRAHNFIFDTSVTAGVPALIIYLSLIGALFWQLQKVKKRHPEKLIICHGIQAALIGYLTVNFFGFDNFSTYLIFFLLISYSLYLMYGTSPHEKPHINQAKGSFIYHKLHKYRYIAILIILIFSVWFLWFFNIKPLQINKEINLAARYYLPEENCEKALAIMENILPSNSIIDHYLRLEYIDIINQCLSEMPEKKLDLVQKEIAILEENTKLRPYYTRNWWFLGKNINFLIGNYKALGTDGKNLEKLKEEAYIYFKKAHQLRPRDGKILSDWAKTDLLLDDYQKAKEKSQECLDINPNAKECLWQKGLANIYLGQMEEGKADIEIAKEKGYKSETKDGLLQLAKAYIYIKDYQALVDIYQKLIIIEPDNYEYHGSLALCYKELGQFEKAREEALIIIELAPELKAEVEEFLRNLE